MARIPKEHGAGTITETVVPNAPLHITTRAYRTGSGCTVLVAREPQGWHLSIAHEHRYPTWDEIADVRYKLLPDEVYMAIILPPKAEYVNLHDNCFHLHEVPS